jgi:hypothetical protein
LCQQVFFVSFDFPTCNSVSSNNFGINHGINKQIRIGISLFSCYLHPSDFSAFVTNVHKLYIFHRSYWSAVHQHLWADRLFSYKVFEVVAAAFHSLLCLEPLQAWHKSSLDFSLTFPNMRLLSVCTDRNPLPSSHFTFPLQALHCPKQNHSFLSLYGRISWENGQGVYGFL